MLDTNTASYFVNGRSAAVRESYFATELHAKISLSVITEAEIRFGLARKPEALKLRRAFEDFFVSLDVLPWSREAAKTYAQLRAGLNATGKSLSDLDMLIAAHAIAVGAVLVSHDKAFQQLTPWLQVIDWATDL